MRRRICVFTGTRAEYGLLRWVMHDIQASDDLDLQLIVSGMHLEKRYGNTYQEIEDHGFTADASVEIDLVDDSPSGVIRSMALCMEKVGDEIKRLSPDIFLVLGDRYEAFAAATAAMLRRVPIAHVHGGEATEGVIDEAIRHSITKMSHVHFVAAESFRERVVQLGERPDTGHGVGGMGVDSISRSNLLDRNELEKTIGFNFGEKSLLITFHPVTLEPETSSQQIEELLAALQEFPEIHLLFTMPNSDSGGHVIANALERFVSGRSNSVLHTSLGQTGYLSCLELVDGVVGNSSSGLLEAPSMNTGTIDIGDRQRGRLRAGSVINCEPRKDAIVESIRELYSLEFQRIVHNIQSPYGLPGASTLIMDTLRSVDLEGILKKEFYSLDRGGVFAPPGARVGRE